MDIIQIEFMFIHNYVLYTSTYITYILYTYVLYILLHMERDTEQNFNITHKWSKCVRIPFLS